jgi:hypothetical protein
MVLLLKLADTLTQYHVKEIQIDGQQQQINLLLNSPMSGEKLRRYERGQVSSKFTTHSGFKKYLYAPFSLTIFLGPKARFVITNKYGFTADVLVSVDKAIKSLQPQVL